MSEMHAYAESGEAATMSVTPARITLYMLPTKAEAGNISRVPRVVVTLFHNYRFLEILTDFGIVGYKILG